MSVIGDNIKFLRRKYQLTQGQFAEKVGVNRPAVGAYEEGRAEPKISTLGRMAEEFELTIDSLVNKVLEKIPEDEFGKTTKDVTGTKLRVLSLTLDEDEKENIQLVPQKAAAGYSNGYSDPEYIQELPKLFLPTLSNGSYRAFEIKGDSMLPVQPGSIVVGKYVENWHDVKSGSTYILVTESEGVLFKRVYNHIYEKGSLLLRSDNTTYQEYELSVEDVVEIWESNTLITHQFPEPQTSQVSVDSLAEMVMKLQSEVTDLKKK